MRFIAGTGRCADSGLICHALRAGDAQALAMEAYGLAEQRQIAAAGGLRVKTLPVDDQGAVVDDLAATTPPHLEAQPKPSPGSPPPWQSAALTTTLRSRTLIGLEMPTVVDARASNRCRPTPAPTGREATL